MRLIAQAKQGFYPAPPEAIGGILRHLKIPDPPPDPKFEREDAKRGEDMHCNCKSGNDCPCSRVPVLTLAAIRARIVGLASRGICRTQVLPGDPNRFARNGLALRTSSAHRERLVLRCLSLPPGIGGLCPSDATSRLLCALCGSVVNRGS